MTLKAKQKKFAKDIAAVTVMFIARPSGRGPATLQELIDALAKGPKVEAHNDPSREFVPDDVRAEWLEVFGKEWRRRLEARIQGQSRGRLTTLAPEMLAVIREVARWVLPFDAGLHVIGAQKRARALLAKLEAMADE